MSGLRRASKIIAVVWALALVAAIPYAVYSKIHFVHHPRTNEVNCGKVKEFKANLVSDFFELRLEIV